MVNTSRKFCLLNTPWKINMEPEDPSLEKENHIPHHFFKGSMSIRTPGCMYPRGFMGLVYSIYLYIDQLKRR